MRYRDWTIDPRPAPTGQPMGPRVRAAVESAMTGVVLYHSAGHPGDENTILEWDYMDASPAKTLLLGGIDSSALTLNLTTGMWFAQRLSPAALVGISAGRIYAKEVAGGCAGRLQFEIWTRNTGTGAPAAKLGVIGSLDVTDLTGVWTGYDFYSAAFGFPVMPTDDGFIVVNGANVTGAGTIGLGGYASANSYWSGTANWSETANKQISISAWIGGPFLFWQGLAKSAGVWGPTATLDLEDGQLYTAAILDVNGKVRIQPTARGGGASIPPATPGLAQDVSVAFGIITELS
jgi:hypothetical protein